MLIARKKVAMKKFLRKLRKIKGNGRIGEEIYKERFIGLKRNTAAKAIGE